MLDESTPSLATSNAEADWPKEFRLSRGILGIGLVCLVFFTAMLVTTFAMSDGAVPPDRVLWLRIMGATVWGMMFVLSVYLLLGYWRERLTVDQDSVTARGILKTVSVEFRDITEVNWWCLAGVKLRTPDVTLSLGLQSYPRDVRVLVAEQIKRHCSNMVEKNWEAFLVHGLRFTATTSELIPPDEMVVIKPASHSQIWCGIGDALIDRFSTVIASRVDFKSYPNNCGIGSASIRRIGLLPGPGSIVVSRSMPIAW